MEPIYSLKQAFPNPPQAVFFVVDGGKVSESETFYPPKCRDILHRTKDDYNRAQMTDALKAMNQPLSLG